METCRHWDFFLFDLTRYLSRLFSLQNTVPFIFFLKGIIEVLRVQRVSWQLEVSSQFILAMLFTQMLLKVFSNWLHGWYHPLIGFLCRWSYWAQNILIMPISAWKSQRKEVWRRLEEEWDFEWREPSELSKHDGVLGWGNSSWEQKEGKKIDF